LAWRKAHPALSQGGIKFVQAGEHLLVFERRHEGQAHWCAFNFSPAPHTLPLPSALGKGRLVHLASPEGESLRLQPFGAFLAEAHG
jgi:hypothetical protein